MTIAQLNEKHQGWQKDLLGLSTRSEHVVIPAATHLSILTQPEYVARVADAIRRLLGARGS
jgi:pimeloyl-ACP methyl ester carboxylesterase